MVLRKGSTSWWGNSIIFYCGKKPKSYGLHRDIIDKIIPIDAGQKLYYINQHSKCLQASHSISIENRSKIIHKLLFEFNDFFKSLEKEGMDNIKAFIDNTPFVSLINSTLTD